MLRPGVHVTRTSRADAGLPSSDMIDASINTIIKVLSDFLSAIIIPLQTIKLRFSDLRKLFLR